jgi:dinuclear metal center YbgI/SA1388 family protein
MITMITIGEVIDHLEQHAPLSYQEEYDNSGLLTGNRDWPVKGILVSLDCTEEVIEEARNSNCNLVVSHHPIVFKGLKRLTGRNYVERTIIKAIKDDIAIYAIHTNLDNVRNGVNSKIAERIGLKDLTVLVPKQQVLTKLTTFVPTENANAVAGALHAAGAGQIGDYKNCSFRVQGTGHFEPTGAAQPHIGAINKAEQVSETRIEVILPSHLQKKVVGALKASHPYEQVAFYLHTLVNEDQHVGSGLIGELAADEEPIAFLRRLKSSMSTQCVRHTALTRPRVKKVAVCGGSGRFLLEAAMSRNADVYVSSDFKYHEFFDADGRIIIADIGHYESEQFTKELLVEVLREKFTTFAINFSKKVTNPISYL